MSSVSKGGIAVPRFVEAVEKRWFALRIAGERAELSPAVASLAAYWTPTGRLIPYGSTSEVFGPSVLNLGAASLAYQASAMGDWFAPPLGTPRRPSSDGRRIAACIENKRLHGVIEEVQVAGLASTARDGRVATVTRGVSISNAAAGAQGLPNVDPVYTWVRLAQRVPVRIAIDEVPPGVPLRKLWYQPFSSGCLGSWARAEPIAATSSTIDKIAIFANGP